MATQASIMSQTCPTGGAAAFNGFPLDRRRFLHLGLASLLTLTWIRVSPFFKASRSEPRWGELAEPVAGDFDRLESFNELKDTETLTPDESLEHLKKLWRTLELDYARLSWPEKLALRLKGRRPCPPRPKGFAIFSRPGRPITGLRRKSDKLDLSAASKPLPNQARLDF